MVAHAFNSNYLGGWGTRITWNPEVKVAMSWDYTTALQLGWCSETLSQKQNNKNNGSPTEFVKKKVKLMVRKKYKLHPKYRVNGYNPDIERAPLDE